MSIPKEPRQLMINLMYIVLTALLALNVSAEIINAFFTIDRSLNESSLVVGQSNAQLLAAISQQAEAYSQYEVYQDKAMKAQEISSIFYEQVETLRQQIIEEAGGLDEDGFPIRKTDKNITTRLLLNEGGANLLKEQIEETRASLLALIEEETNKRLLSTSIPLHISEPPATAETQDWASFTFQQMPVAAVLPILGKFQNDVKITETAILNYLLEKTNGEMIKPNAFVPVIAAEKSYIIRGEDYTGEILLAAYSSTADNIRVKVDGEALVVENGKAFFKKRARTNGRKKHQLEIELENPITGEVERFEKEFTYEVGERSVTVAADKMNVLYIGVENPLSISAAGVRGSLQVNANGTSIEKRGGKYIAKPTRKGLATISVSGQGLAPTQFEYRVKRIPDPVIKLGTNKGGSMKVAAFKVQQGLIADLEDFDFDARCNVQSFEVARVPKNADVQSAINEGGRFRGEAKRIVENAKRNDTYYFEKVKVRCPGDTAGRSINGLIFHIK